MVATRILTDRFGDTWTVCAGKEAAAIRRQILAEQDALPKVTMTREEIEREVARRVAAAAPTGPLAFGLNPSAPLRVFAEQCPSRKEGKAA